VQASSGSTNSTELDNARAATQAGNLSNNGTRLNANQTAATRGRTGIALQNRIQGTATTDPRSLLSADGGTAAMMGAQQASGKQPTTRLSSSNAGVDADTLSQNAGINIRPAGPPGAATDGDGNPITVSTEFNTGPPKLPGVGPGQDTLTDTQLAQLEDGIPAGGNDPTSSTNPSNQDIATDGG
jgi:hypothetical protein